MNKVILSLLAILTMAACSPKSAKTGLPALRVGKDAVQVTQLEQGSENIAYWVKNGAKDRVLVRLSAFDGLAPVDEAALKALKGLRDKGDFSALKAGGDSLGADRLYTSDNVVYVAHRLGLVRLVYWVVPSFGGVTAEDLQDYKAYFDKRFPGQTSEIEGVKLNGKVAEGTINGVPVKLLGLEDMPPMDEPVLLDTDVSYLAALYKDEKDTRMLSFVAGFFATLKKAGLNTDQATITASDQDGKASLKFRFMVKTLATLYGLPAMIDGEPPPLWSQRGEAWRVEQKNPKLSIPLYQSIVKQFPDDAASHYDLSAAYFTQGDMDSCLRELAEAAKLDRGYAAGYRDFAGRLRKSGKDGQAREFMAKAGAHPSQYPEFFQPAAEGVPLHP